MSDPAPASAVEPFARPGLQLLIVTPLQKIHVIEPYVAAVGFVENGTGMNSALRTMTIEQKVELRVADRVQAGRRAARTPTYTGSLPNCTILGLPVGHLTYVASNEDPAQHVIPASGLRSSATLWTSTQPNFNLFWSAETPTCWPSIFYPSCLDCPVRWGDV